MAKTLKQLFKTQKLDTGTTGQAKYEIRNSKDTDITTSNPLLAGTSFPLVNKLRKGPTSERRKETLLEEETTGLRPLRLLSIPVLYGTDIIRLTTLRTGMIDDMKAGTNGGIDAGLYGNAINKLKTKALGLAGKLGIKFPQEIIPSRLKTNLDFQSSLEPDTMATLAKIKGDAAGNLVGKFLAKNAKGTPEQIRNQAIGSAISLVKDEARKFLFGGRKSGQSTLAKKSPSQVQYDRKTTYSSTVDKLNTEEVSKRNDLSTIAEVKTKIDKNPPLQSQAPYVTKEGFGYRILSDGTKEIVNTYIGANMTIEEAKAQVTDFLRTSNKINKLNGTENPDGSFSYPPPFTTETLAGSRKEAQQDLAKAKGIDTATRINYGSRLLTGTKNPGEKLFGYSDYIDPKAEIEFRADLSTKLNSVGGMSFSSQRLAGNPNNITIYDPVPEPPQKDLLQEFRNTEPLYDPITGDVIQMPPENSIDLKESRKEGQQILAEKIEKRNGYQYLKYEGGVNPYTTTIDPTAIDGIKLRNDLSSRLANFGLTDEYDKIVAPTNLKMSVYGVGIKYDDDAMLDGLNSKFGFPEKLRVNNANYQSDYARRLEQNIPNFYTSTIKYSRTKDLTNRSEFPNDLSDILVSRQGNAYELPADITPYDDVDKNRQKSAGIDNDGVPKLEFYNKSSKQAKKRYSSKADDISPQVETNLSQLFHDDMISIRQGDGYGNSRLIVNTKAPYEGDGDLKLSLADFITLRFYSVFLNTSVNFLSTITGLTENWTPSWETNKFIGSPFNFYTYESVERSVSFQFKIFSTDLDEHQNAWERLNFLSRLTLPQGYGGQVNYVQPPIIQLTMGDIYHKRSAFIETLSYTVDDTYTWDSDTYGYKLPKVISVDITLKLLLSKASTNGVNLYDYGDGTPNIASKKQKQNSSGADSIPIKNKPLVIPKVIIPAPKITIPGTPPPPPVKVENPVVTTTKKPIPKKVKEKKPDPIVPKKENKYIQKVPQGPVIQTLTTGVAKSPYQQKLKSKIPLKPKKLIVFPPVKFGGGDFAGAGAGGSRRGDTRGDF